MVQDWHIACDTRRHRSDAAVYRELLGSVQRQGRNSRERPGTSAHDGGVQRSGDYDRAFTGGIVLSGVQLAGYEFLRWHWV